MSVLGFDRNPRVRRYRALKASKSGRSDAENRVASSSQGDRLTDEGRVRVEGTPPESVANHNDRFIRDVSRGERATARRADPENVEIVRRYQVVQYPLGFRSDAQGLRMARVGQNSLERMNRAAEISIVGIRETGILTLLRRRRDPDETSRVLRRPGPQQCRLGHTEHGGVHANP